MINIRLLKGNTIVTLDTPGKNIIKSSAGAYFHSPMELLTVAVGSCVGKHIVRYCSQNKINVETFESIAIDMKDRDFYIYVQHPKTLTDEQINELEEVIKNCDVSKMLTGDIYVEFSLNKVDPDVSKPKKSCCGG